MDTVELSVLREPESGAGKGTYHQEIPSDIGEVSRQGIFTTYLGTHGQMLTDILDESARDVPPLKGLSFLDRFLVIWIVIAMALGIILGHFVPSTGPALQRGQFVGVSLPIGMFPKILYGLTRMLMGSSSYSDRTSGHDVPDPLQSSFRNAPPPFEGAYALDPPRHILCA